MINAKMDIQKRSYFIVLFVLVIIFSNCSKDKKQIDHDKTLYKLHDSIIILKNKVIGGDTIAYINLRTIFQSYYNYPQEFYLYSIIMANDYHYPPAYFDVHRYLLGIYCGDFSKMDKESRELSILHLRRGAKLNYEPCKTELAKLNIKETN